MGVNIQQGSGKHKDLNYEVNLVSFVDLLSVCICFLLMTAVWLQVSSLQVKQSHGTEAAAPTDSYDVSVVLGDDNKVLMKLLRNDKVIMQQSLLRPEQAAIREAYAAQLDVMLKQQNLTIDQIGGVFITPSPQVNYGYMVALMDSFRAKNLVNLAVVPTRWN